MAWQVEVLGETVADEILALPKKHQAKYQHIVELIESEGVPAVGRPYVKHLEEEIWEKRIKAQGGISRALYVTAKRQRVIVLHALVKKTTRTPKRALQTATDRAKEARLI